MAQIGDVHTTAFLICHLDRLAAIDIDGVCLIYTHESFLQEHHELYLGIKAAHLVHCLLEVHGFSVVGSEQDHLQIILDALHAC